MADSSSEIQAKQVPFPKTMLRILKYPIYFAVLLLVWFSILNFPSRVAGVSLDESWQRSFAYFFKHRLQAGTDFVFTYGPLGYFSTSVYDRDLFWHAYFIQIALCFFLVFLLTRSIRNRATSVRNLVSLLFITLFCGALHRDVGFLFFIVLIGITLVEERLTLPIRILCLVALSVLSMGKFVLFGFSVFIVFCSEVLFRLKNRRRILSPVPLFVAIFVLLYLLLGQSLTAFPKFLHSSFEISSGYNEAMSTEGDAKEIYLSLGILFLLESILIHIHLQNKKDPVTVGKLMIIGMALLLSWKQAFIRQDNHTGIFFGYALLAALILVLHFHYGSLRRSLSLIALFLVVGASIHGSNTKELLKRCERRIKNSITTLVFPIRARETMDKKEKILEKQWALPLFAKQIQGASVDILSFQQGILLLNRMNWKPRPVFQGYSAYTAYLAQRNADFFRMSTSPEFLLFRLQSIDDRYPSLDDNLTLFEIASRYQPVAVERSLLLLKKVSNEPSSISVAAEIKQTLSFNQEVTAARKFPYQILFVDIQDTFLGKLRKILFKPPHIYMKVKTSAGNSSYRMIPGPARKGFLLSPLLRNTGDLCLLFGLGNGTNIRNFSFVTDSPGLWFKNSIRIVLQGANQLSTTTQDQDRLALIRDSLSSDINFSATSQAVQFRLSGGHSQDDEFQALFRNGKMFTDRRTLTPGEYRLLLVGYGTKAGNEFAGIHLSLNDRVIRTISLNESKKYEFPLKISKEQPCQFTVEFYNDDVIGKEDRNVFIKAIYVLPVTNPASLPR